MEALSGPLCQFLLSAARTLIKCASSTRLGWAVEKQEEDGYMLSFLLSLSLSFLFFQVHPSTVVRIWREKGQELRVAGIYELRVQPAFGEGEGKGLLLPKQYSIFLKAATKP